MALEGLEGLIKGLENQDSWQAQQQFRLVLLHWPKSVGFAVARKTRPVSIQRETLYVATATASWAQTLAYERLNIVKKLNRYQRRPLKDIRFSTAQWTQAQGAQNQTTVSFAAAEHAAARKQVPERLAQHPSYVGNVEHVPIQHTLDQQPPDPRTPDQTIQTHAKQTPQTAFQRWALTLQARQQLQVICPVCHCHCPRGELARWARCGHCATKHWQ